MMKRILLLVVLVTILAGCGSSGQAEGHYNQAKEYRQQGQLDQAIEEYTQAIALDPLHAEAYAGRCGAYADAGDYDQAIADCTQAIALDPQLALAYRNRGRAYANTGSFDQAIADYDQATTLDPQYAEAYAGRCGAYISQGDYDQAIADCTQAITLDPQLALAYVNRGLIYAHTGDYDQAIADYDQAIALDPQYAVAYYLRGELYTLMGEREQATADLERALELGLQPPWQQKAEALLDELELYGASQGGLPLATDPYRDEEGGFTIRHPEGWWCTRDIEWYGSLGCSAGMWETKGMHLVLVTSGSLQDWGITNPNAAVNPRDILARFVQIPSDSVSGQNQIGEIQDTVVGEQPAAFVDSTTSYGYYGVPQTARIVVVYVGDRIIGVNCLAAPEVWEEYLPTFEAMIASMTFFEP